MSKPRFEKVDANTIRIIIEKIDEVPLAKLLENRGKLLAYKKNLQEQLKEGQAKIKAQEEAVNQSLKNIEEILAEGKKLGIVVKEKSKDVEKGK